MLERFDFSGYATKNDLKCADGRTIRKNAFKDCDGITVPLVWGHKHGSPSNILGHAILENRPDGVYTYGVFNDTEAGKTAKELVRHGDISALSIYANNLVQKAGDVLHGMIREVSLCLAGANPGAKIEDLSIEHSWEEDSEDFEALIYNGRNIDNITPPIEQVIAHNQAVAREQEMYQAYIAHAQAATNEEETKMAGNPEEMTVKEIFDTLTEAQKNVVYYMIGEALKKQGDNKEEGNMAHNVFENDTRENVITHDMMATVLAEAKKYGTLKDSFEHHMQEGVLAHAVDTTDMEVPEMSNADYADEIGYGINSPDFLFPDPRTLNNIPEFIKRDTDWVDVVWANVHKSPFSRVKSVFANITEDEARAKGYLKATQKKNEFFSLMKRTTSPQTIYKKQKMDRDDIIDITDFDVVAWIKSEMRLMLNEELARAILIGDGRTNIDDDKIKEDCIRPIVSDAPVFTIKKLVTAGNSDEATAKNFMRAAIRARKDYKGSGSPTLFTTEDVLTSMLLIEDGIGHYMYKSENELATALRVSKIVTVPVMEGYTDASENELLGVIVNLKDYNVGADKGGAINMFDDFNIDYNQYIYLIETRCSGALTKPYSAIALFKEAGNSTSDVDPEVNGDG